MRNEIADSPGVGDAIADNHSVELGSHGCGCRGNTRPIALQGCLFLHCSLIGFCLPDLDRSITACAGYMLAIREPVERIDGSGAYVMVGSFAATLDLPDMDDMIAATRGDALSIRGPVEMVDPVIVATIERGDMTFVEWLPELYAVVFSCRGESGIVRRPGDSADPAMVSPVREILAPLLAIPDLYLLPGARGDGFTIGRPGKGADQLGVALIGE